MQTVSQGKTPYKEPKLEKSALKQVVLWSTQIVFELHDGCNPSSHLIGQEVKFVETPNPFGDTWETIKKTETSSKSTLKKKLFSFNSLNDRIKRFYTKKKHFTIHVTASF